MDYVRAPLAVSLVEETRGKHVCFAADLFKPRPAFKEIMDWQQCAGELQEKFLKLMDRRACPIEWLAFFIDGEGAIMLVATKTEMQVNNVRSGLSTVLGPLPKEQQKAVADSLRPLDELDKERIGKWQTVDELRPEEDEEDGDEGEARAEPAPTLALRTEGLALLEVDRATQVKIAWAARAQAYATIVLAQTGPPPELTYIRCRREERRHLLLTRRLREQGATVLADCVRIAAQLAKDSSLPAPGGRRTAEFMRRCAEAIKAVNPKAETDPSQLPREEREAVRRALGDEKEPYQGCLSEGCLDQAPSWETHDLGDGLQLSRCVRCRMPKSWGRTVTSPLDFIKESLKRERGMTARLAEENTRNVRRRF